jgi:hypothetical protein
VRFFITTKFVVVKIITEFILKIPVILMVITIESYQKKFIKVKEEATKWTINQIFDRLMIN